jgi:hypothetical protein
MVISDTTSSQSKVGGQPHLAAHHLTRFPGFTTGRAYAMGEGKRAFVTDQHVIAGLGKKVEPYPFIAISSGRFTEVWRPVNRCRIRTLTSSRTKSRSTEI